MPSSKFGSIPCSRRPVPVQLLHVRLEAVGRVVLSPAVVDILAVHAQLAGPRLGEGAFVALPDVRVEDPPGGEGEAACGADHAGRPAVDEERLSLFRPVRIDAVVIFLVNLHRLRMKFESSSVMSFFLYFRLSFGVNI